MTDRAGQQCLSGAGGYLDGPISADMSTMDFIGWPPSHADESELHAATLTRHLAAAAPRVIAVAGMRSYFDDYYYRVHLLPTHLDFGNLVSSQFRTVQVWNAFPATTLSLASIDELNAGGINYTGPGDLPLSFAPLQQREWSVSVSTDGPPIIDAALRWTFVGGEAPELTLTGRRLTAWMIAPDWANNVTETLSWLTDVQNAANGTQLRQPLREVPRREWEFGVIAEGVERQIMENALYDWSSRTWALPVWVDMTWLTASITAGTSVVAIDTTNLDFVEGGLVAFYRSATSFELAEILALTSNSITLKQALAKAWGTGDRIVPARTATLTDFPTLNRKHDERVDAQLRFAASEDCAWPAIAPATTYLGIPVLETRTDEPQDLAAMYRRQIVTLDNDVGTPTIDDFSNLTWVTQPFYWLVQGRAQRAALRSLLYWLDGRGNALWLPSWNADITLAATLVADATTMTVVASGITRFVFGKPGRRHIRIELKSGTVYYRQLTAAAEVDDQTEQLVLDSALGAQVMPAQIRQISWLMLATLNSDRVEIGHVHDSMGTATAGTTFVGVPQEEP